MYETLHKIHRMRGDGVEVVPVGKVVSDFTEAEVADLLRLGAIKRRVDLVEAAEDKPKPTAGRKKKAEAPVEAASPVDPVDPPDFG